MNMWVVIGAINAVLWCVMVGYVVYRWFYDR